MEEGERLNKQLEKSYKADFMEPASSKIAPSREDRRAREIMESSCKFVDGHYELPLLWKYDRPVIASIMPSEASELTARNRTLKMEKRLSSSPD